MYNRDKIMNVLQEIKDASKDNKPYVIICQPRRNFTDPMAQHFDAMMGIDIDMHGFTHAYTSIEKESVDVARNWCFERALDSNAKYMLFIGDDTVMPYDGFMKLHETAEKNPETVVAGVYYFKNSSPMIMVKDEDGYVCPADCTPGQVFEAFQTGMDAMLIPMSIVRKLKSEDSELPFCCIAFDIPDIPFVGEDVFFIHRLKRLGIKVLVNTDVQCLHMDVFTGKYTAHPSVDLKNYRTIIPITTPLTLEDKERIDKSWLSRTPNIPKAVNCS